jgi:hypothetical protein
MMCASWRWISTGADKPFVAVSGLSGDPISREIPQGGEVNRARWLLGLESITRGAGAAGSGSSGCSGFYRKEAARYSVEVAKLFLLRSLLDSFTSPALSH